MNQLQIKNKYSTLPVCSLFCTLMWFARSRGFLVFFFFGVAICSRLQIAKKR